MAINEAMALDDTATSSTPANNKLNKGSNRTFANRQEELAMSIQAMLHLGESPDKKGGSQDVVLADIKVSMTVNLQLYSCSYIILSTRLTLLYTCILYCCDIKVEDGISRRALQSAGSEGRPMAGPVSVEDQTITFVTPKGQILVPRTLTYPLLYTFNHIYTRDMWCFML